MSLQSFVQDLTHSGLTSPELQSSSLSRSLALISHEFSQDRGRGCALDASSIKDSVARTASRFQGFAQQDAQEFLSHVLDRLSDEMDAVEKARKEAETQAGYEAKTASDSDTDEDVSVVTPRVLAPASPLRNPTTLNFGFTVELTRSCLGAGCTAQPARIREHFRELSLDLPDTLGASGYPSIQYLVEHYFAVSSSLCRHMVNQCVVGIWFRFILLGFSIQLEISSTLASDRRSRRKAREFETLDMIYIYIYIHHILYDGQSSSTLESHSQNHSQIPRMQ